MSLSDEYVLALYERAGASWFFEYTGSPIAPHAILTSGKHSDGYVDSRKLLASPRLATHLMYELVRRLHKSSLSDGVDIVASSAYSAITFGYELARHLAIEVNPDIRFEFVEKNPAFETDKSMPRFICKFPVPEYAKVLRAEELITTFETTGAVRDAVELANPHGRIRWNPDVACGILRPDSDRAMMAFGDIIYLAKKIVKNWDPADLCPLCAQGSPALKPKSYWAELTGKAA